MAKKITFNKLCKALDRYTDATKEYSNIGGAHPDDRQAIEDEFNEARAAMMSLFNTLAPHLETSEAQYHRHSAVMTGLQTLWEENQAWLTDIHAREKGIRSSQISALVLYLVKTGVIK